MTTRKRSFRWRDEFIELGFGIIATWERAATLQAAGIPVTKVFKLREGRPNVLDRVINGDINFIINTPSGKIPREDEVTIRNASLAKKIPIMTTVRAAQASAERNSLAPKKSGDSEEPAGISRERERARDIDGAFVPQVEDETNVVLLPDGIGARLHSSAWRGKERHIFHE